MNRFQVKGFASLFLLNTHVIQTLSSQVNGGTELEELGLCFEDDWTTGWWRGTGAEGGVSGNGWYIECNIDRVSEKMVNVERDKGIRYMFLQSVWRTAFGAAQYLEAETLQ